MPDPSTSDRAADLGSIPVLAILPDGQMLPAGRTLGAGELAVVLVLEKINGPDPDLRCPGFGFATGLESPDPESSPEWLLRGVAEAEESGFLLPALLLLLWVSLPREPEELELLLAAGRLRRGETGDPRSEKPPPFASGLSNSSAAWSR